MNPPLVSFNVMRSSASYPGIRQAGRFVVNILSDEQVRISNQFAQRGADKWREVEWRESPLGNPIIAGSLHWLDCEIYAEHAAGDHLIVIGEVKALDLQEAAATQPLLYFKDSIATSPRTARPEGFSPPEASLSRCRLRQSARMPA